MREKEDLHDAKQSQDFINKARELGCAEDEAMFKAKLAAVARQKPKVAPAPAMRDKGKR